MDLWEKIKKFFSKEGQKDLWSQFKNLFSKNNLPRLTDNNIKENNSKSENTNLSFRKLLRQSTYIGMSKEELQSHYAMALGIPTEILCLPGIKRRLFDLKIFKEIDDVESFKKAKNNIQQNFEIIESNDKLINNIYKQHSVTITNISDQKYIRIHYNGPEIRVTFNKSISPSNSASPTEQIEESVFNENHIEVERIMRQNDPYGNVITHRMQRDKKEIEKVKVIENSRGSIYESVEEFDLSRGKGDLATLDNCGKSHTFDTSIYIESPRAFDTNENTNTRKQRVLQKIGESQYKANLEGEQYDIDLLY